MTETKRKSKKTSSSRLPARLEDLMNVGKAVAGDLRLIGIKFPGELIGKDPYALYEKLCRKTKQRHDPCMIDTFISIVRFADGGIEKAWWNYTGERKSTLSLEPWRVAGATWIKGKSSHS